LSNVIVADLGESGLGLRAEVLDRDRLRRPVLALLHLRPGHRLEVAQFAQDLVQR